MTRIVCGLASESMDREATRGNTKVSKVREANFWYDSLDVYCAQLLHGKRWIRQVRGFSHDGDYKIGHTLMVSTNEGLRSKWAVKHLRTL